jgi:hypothetical protein
MKKIYFAFLLSFICLSVFSQTFSYLNASTGSKGQFFTDADTNLYMWHKDRFEKVDKNFNPIWVKTYSGMEFNNVLLSKTGSLFFIAKTPTGNSGGSYIGKLDANGNLVWIKSLVTMTVTATGTTQITNTTDCTELLLDRNNNLVYSGMFNYGSYKAFFMKADTNGNILKMRLFDPPPMYSGYTGLNLLRDSAGHYKFYALGLTLAGNMQGIFNFSDVADSINSVNYFSSALPGNLYSYNLFRSKTSTAFYLAFTSYASSQDQCFIHKFRTNGQNWGRTVNFAPSSWMWGFDEDEEGNLFVTTSTGPSSSSFRAGFTKIDTNGVSDGKVKLHFTGYTIGTGFPPNFPMTRLNVLYYNKYFADVTGPNFPFNPLTIAITDSSLMTSCSNTIVTSTSAGTGGGLFSGTVAKTHVVTSYTLQTFSPIVSPVINFSVNANFCLTLGVNSFTEKENEIQLFPNPAADKLFIKAENASIKRIVVTDVNGATLSSDQSSEYIEISQLPSGIYFVEIESDAGTKRKKFIKQ